MISLSGLMTTYYKMTFMERKASKKCPTVQWLNGKSLSSCIWTQLMATGTIMGIEKRIFENVPTLLSWRTWIFPNSPPLMALKLEFPSCLKIFHSDSRAHPARPVISPMPAGRDATATYPNVNHPVPLPFIPVGRRVSKVDGKVRDVSLPEK